MALFDHAKEAYAEDQNQTNEFDKDESQEEAGPSVRVGSCTAAWLHSPLGDALPELDRPALLERVIRVSRAIWRPE